MTAEQLKFLGHGPLKSDGSTLAVTPTTANAGGVGGGVYDPDSTIT
jgi:hypothetical protein